MIIFTVIINGSAAGSPNKCVLCSLQSSLRRATRRELAIHICGLNANGAESPDETYL